jgi:hypothetical protein
MQQTGVAMLATWQTFYVILGSAAATLTGLMFIVITLMAGARIRVSTAYLGISAFNTPTVVHFCAVLLIAAILCVPWQALWNVSLVLGLSAVGGVVYVVTTVPQMRRMTDYQPKVNDWVWYFSIPLILYAALVVAALVLPGNPVLALYAIGATTVLFLFTGIHNAWDLVTYLAVELSHPESE